MPFNLPRVTKALLIANLVAYLLQWVVGEQAYAFLELWPYVPDAPEQWFMPWQLLTYGFLHDPATSPTSPSTCWRWSCSAHRWNTRGGRAVT